MSRTRIIKDLLVLGHPRSGTGYMAKSLQMHGFDVRHEAMGTHGISSWMFAVESSKVPYSFDNTAPDEFSFRHLIHVVRNPINVIASTAYTEICKRKVVDFMSQFVTVDRDAFVLPAVQTYLGWNKLIRSRGPDITIRVEEADKTLPEYLRATGLLDSTSDRDESKLPSKRHNSRKHRRLDWRRIRELVPGPLCGELMEFTTEIGYEVDDK